MYKRQGSAKENEPVLGVPITWSIIPGLDTNALINTLADTNLTL
jgi:hypothetical protein